VKGVAGSILKSRVVELGNITIAENVHRRQFDLPK
jgi:hypothetical protein